MKISNFFGATIVLLALVLAAGGVLIGSPEREAGVAERINLPLHNPSVSPGRDDANEIVFEEDFENDAEGWTSGDQSTSDPSWHKSDYMGRENGDVLWWCGDTITGNAVDYVGYNNYWQQFLDTPVLNLSNAGNNLRLTFDAKWLLEDPRRVPPPQGWDGWDGWLVLISTNGGEDFQVIRPTSPAYTAEHLSAAERFWLLEGDWPGWVFESDPDGRDGWEAANDTVITPEWVECSFDLSQYRSNNVVIRMVLLTDRTVAAPFNFYLAESGVWVDDILIEDGNGNVFLSNNGTDDPEPEELISRSGPGFGDTWALTRENVHSGTFSMWNDDDNFNVINGLDSPPFTIPEGFNTHLEYWVRCDLPDAVHQGSQALSDFYQIYISADEGATWTYVTHDYNRPEAGGDDWTHYVPGVPFTGNTDLSLSSDTAFIGETVQLRWWFRTDADHREGDGTGLFIDDIQVVAENRQPRDAGFENMYIPYPTTVRYRTRGVQSTMYNYGTRDLTQIWSFWGWYGGENFTRSVRVIPNPSITNGDSLVINLSDYADRQNPGWTPLYPGSFTVFARSAVGSATPGDDADDDQYTGNDSTGVRGVRVWPAGVFELGYDNRTVRFRNEFAAGTGAAARYSPADAGVNNYTLAFAHFRFSGMQQAATFRLHVRRAGQDDNTPGADLVAFNVEVPPDSSMPGNMTVDLSNRQELRNLQGDFWLWAEVTQNGFNPQITSDELLRGTGRFFTFNGNQAQAFNGDLAMHATVIPAANVDPNLAESEQLVDFGEVVIDQSEAREFGLYSTGLNPVTITSVRSSEDAFTIDFPGQTTLRTGEAVWFIITFNAPDDQVHAGDLIFETNDGAPPNVTIVGSGTQSVSEDGVGAPLTFGLAAPYPNPFNSTTRIDYSLNQAGRISLALYDLSGRQIRVLVDQTLPSGRHSAVLQASDIPAGLYIIRLNSGQMTSSQKVLLVK